ncbi:MAG: FtsQ-type POTRA domain-containing protein [Limosilactobacillus sp.]|uniref:cell division protein FtsQ/DivIB n=1 Tax=Limosilactobacillus sp. TaxID=2773925 RepID=UPI002704E7FA|nr:FtsQ-type POTRA domain-containing protein [Limosilactobacillus sp.]
MDNNHGIPEHRRYSDRLSQLERNSANRPTGRAPKDRIGNKVTGIKKFRHRSNGRRVFKLVFLFGIVLLGALYVISPFSKVKTITFAGHTEMTHQEIEDATQVRPGRYIWGTVMTQKHINKVAHKRNPEVRSVKIKATGAQSIRMEVTENRVVGTVEIGNSTYSVLSNGQLKPDNSKKSQIQYKNFGGKKKALAATAIQIGKLKKVIIDDISTISYEPSKNSPNKIVLYMRDGNTVYANRTNVGTKMKYYPAIANTMKNSGIVDLQVGAYSYDYGSKEK